MNRNDYVFTSESVSEGHPDKLCDQISDAILDEMMSADPLARVACETFATSNRVVIGGEVGMRDPHALNSVMERVPEIAKGVIRDVGYDQDNFSWKTCHVENLLHPQSVDIAMGVDREGAGDQGIMFGYATDETAHFMPAPIYYAHQILGSISHARRTGRGDEAAYLLPDAKSQISVRYDSRGVPTGVAQIVVSHQHREGLTPHDVRSIIEPHVVQSLPDGWVGKDTVWHVNPTGKFVIGGPDGDAGLTGRKIIVDTYGGAAPHGGGAFSGKDPTKVDRSAAYAARYLAKNVVASGLARKCLIQLSYAIGVKEPLSIYVDTMGTGLMKDRDIESMLPKIMDLTPQGIMTHLNLLRPVYRRTASYGHFGRTPDEDGGFSWEATDLVEKMLRG